MTVDRAFPDQFADMPRPFYVLAETRSPRKTFPKYTVLALTIAIVLFVLVNISYLLVVDKDDVLSGSSGNTDLATLFFDRLFRQDDPTSETDRTSERAMAALIAISIFGNLWVMTFTAGRVKQEIAKEGILPFSLYIASAYTTPCGLWQRYTRRHRDLADDESEKAPTAAFVLHWLTSVLLIAVTSSIHDPRKAYSALISLYSYTIILVIGCWVSVGLLMVKFRQQSFGWQQRRRYRPWLSPVHAIFYAVATSWLLITAFLKPQQGSPFHQSVTHIIWYVVPTIGITSPIWGLIWYLGILVRQRLIGRHLVVRREAYWEPDPEDECEYVERAEWIVHDWQITLRGNMPENFSPPAGAVDSEESGPEGIRRELGQPPMVQASQGGPVNGARRLSDSFDI